MLKMLSDLMQRLLDAGYPREEMYHGIMNGPVADLYVYANKITYRVIEKWCKDNGFDRRWNCPLFIDQITGEPMFDCAFQYFEEGG